MKGVLFAREEDDYICGMNGNSNTGVESWDAKNLWIRELMDQHGEWLCDRFRDALERNKNVDTGNLMDSIAYDTTFDGSAFGYTTLRVKFMDYGRMFEIAGYQKNKKSKFGANTNRDIWGIKENREKKRKNTRWYAVNMYSGLSALIQRIAAGMTESERSRILGILNNKE